MKNYDNFKRENKMIIYCLSLENNKFYIGKTSNINYRLEDHFELQGSEWTKLFKPIKIIETFEIYNDFAEDMITLTYMKTYGIENVRGGSFSSIILDKSSNEIIQKMIFSSQDKCFGCGQTNHFIKNCFLKKVRCYKCKSYGHYANKCEIKTQKINNNEIKKDLQEIKNDLQEIKKEINNSEIKKENNNSEIKKEIKDIDCSLKSFHGKWLCFDKSERGSSIIANRKDIGEFEKLKFIFQDQMRSQSDCAFIKSIKFDTYLTSDHQGNVSQTKDPNSNLSLWKIIKKDNNNIGIMNLQTNMFLCAEKGLFGVMEGFVIADRKNLGKFETWSMSK